MKTVFNLVLFFCVLAAAANAQTATVSGKVMDIESNEPAVSAVVTFTKDFRAKADADGEYTIENVPYGKYKVMITLATFDTVYTLVEINKPQQEVNLQIGNSKILEETIVTANLVQDRKTPVAVTNVGKKEITEELGSQDLPMILNSKPGVHATQQGGGDGDARITIRGFDQRNVGVMIDGVPVNDMENGWVYWSNWFGLDAITQQIQVQRGLGATKMAMPSVGGMMNIISESPMGKQEIKFTQEYGSGDFFRTSLSYKSGTLKNGWGVIASASYKQGNGWVNGLMTQGGFYYAKIQKIIGKHVLSLSGFGAPQQHGQRSYNQSIGYWDSEYAERLGVTTGAMSNRGRRYNQHYGFITNENGQREQLNERLNYFHKPQITLKDFWKINDKVSWTNIAYTSIGRGGGQQAYSSSNLTYAADGTIDWDYIVQTNRQSTVFGQVFPNVDPSYSATEIKSNNILAAAVNNHFWVGAISQVDYKINNDWKFTGGLDYRWYQGEHYYEIRNLLGGDYYIDQSNRNDINLMHRVGDKIAKNPYHNHRDAFMSWYGAFTQIEYSKKRWSWFANLATVVNSYEGKDYFKKKELVLDGGAQGSFTFNGVDYNSTEGINANIYSNDRFYLGAADRLTYNGKEYTNSSRELTASSSGKYWAVGTTIKTGANFNVTDKSNIFLNLGWLNRTPQFSNVIDNNTNEMFKEILNEKIYAIEAGYGFRSKKVSFNVNAYYTIWQNKPFPYGIQVEDPEDPGTYVRANVNGMDALHMGIEGDVAWYVHPKVTIEGMVSVGDWRWTSKEQLNVLGQIYEFDARGVHVGDAAQNVFAASVRWAPFKGFYFKAKYTYFAKYYSNFDPFSLKGENAGRDSWKIPSYGMLNLHAGYSYRMSKSTLHIRGNVFNALNTLYISDARNNYNGSGFDATSATVFLGMGTTFNVSVGIEF